jgi:hypothetical protein
MTNPGALITCIGYKGLCCVVSCRVNFPFFLLFLCFPFHFSFFFPLLSFFLSLSFSFFLSLDAEYVETALLAQRLGQVTIIIIEKLYEMDLVLQASKKLAIKPVIGLRAKLSVKNLTGQSASAGDHAKFGLSPAEMIQGQSVSPCVWCFFSSHLQFSSLNCGSLRLLFLHFVIFSSAFRAFFQ